ncbi:hypothetical protein, conserved [Babesia ovata]|uniref:Uncharacterized protein n=1 Tax=Babesia ovata TaxID=189622 RepID=A0A2H6KJD4_9APIC|nr:uncharacterized protein BOVATA_046060 [Babesia ovata]GBE63113.1 hypothetical protein, conserved [Babesia ovata]
MSFLHGVLESVKEDDNVTQYNNYIKSSNINDGLDKVLQLLTSLIGTGRVGLSDSVGSVKGWLEKYNEEVEEKTEAVKNALKNIRDNIADRDIQKIELAKSNGLKAMHEAFRWSLNDLDGNMKTLRENSIGYNALDKGLKSRLDIALGRIETGINVLKHSAETKGLMERVQYMDEQLVEQGKNIEREIDFTSKQLQKTLADEFNNVISHIDRLNAKKGEDLFT